MLGILAEGPSHGFALSKELGPDAGIGRIFTVRRPLVYRALARLVDQGLAEAAHTEKGDSGPNRVVHRVTRRGRRAMRRWLDTPVDHVRDLRISFLLKVAFLLRAGASPMVLIETQRATLAPTLSALDDPETADLVELWRRNNARAAAAYLEELREIYA